MQDMVQPQLAQALRFNPKWWWDPIPDFYREHLTEKLATELVHIQLNKQLGMMKVEMEALERTMKAFG